MNGQARVFVCQDANVHRGIFSRNLKPAQHCIFENLFITDSVISAIVDVLLFIRRYAAARSKANGR